MARDIYTGPPSANDTEHDLLVNLATSAQALAAAGSFDPASPGPIGGTTPAAIAGTTGTFSGAVTSPSIEVIAKAASDQTFANNTLADYTRLTLALAANTSYKFEWELQFLCDLATPKFQLALTFPASVTLAVGIVAQADAAIEGMSDTDVENDYGSGVQLFAISGNVSVSRIRLYGCITTGANAGTLKVQFAQQNTDAVNLAQLKASSTLRSVKLN